MATETTKIVNVQHLKKCALWPGSTCETFFKYGGLPLAHVIEKRDMLLRCKEKHNDLTPPEVQFLKALELTITETR